jgi:hypothetical protein
VYTIQWKSKQYAGGQAQRLSAVDFCRYSKEVGSDKEEMVQDYDVLTAAYFMICNK